MLGSLWDPIGHHQVWYHSWYLTNMRYLVGVLLPVIGWFHLNPFLLPLFSSPPSPPFQFYFFLIHFVFSLPPFWSPFPKSPLSTLPFSSEQGVGWRWMWGVSSPPPQYLHTLGLQASTRLCDSFPPGARQDSLARKTYPIYLQQLLG